MFNRQHCCKHCGVNNWILFIQKLITITEKYYSLITVANERKKIIIIEQCAVFLKKSKQITTMTELDTYECW